MHENGGYLSLGLKFAWVWRTSLEKKPGSITVYYYLSKGFGEKSVYDWEFLRCWGRGCQALFGDQLAFFASHSPEAKQLLFFGDVSDKGVEKGLATFNLRHGNHHELSFNYFLPLSVKEVGVPVNNVDSTSKFFPALCLELFFTLLTQLLMSKIYIKWKLSVFRI